MPRLSLILLLVVATECRSSTLLAGLARRNSVWSPTCYSFAAGYAMTDGSSELGVFYTAGV